jgi:hypothetical protein
MNIFITPNSMIIQPISRLSDHFLFPLAQAAGVNSLISVMLAVKGSVSSKATFTIEMSGRMVLPALERRDGGVAQIPSVKSVVKNSSPPNPQSIRQKNGVRKMKRLYLSDPIFLTGPV